MLMQEAGNPENESTGHAATLAANAKPSTDGTRAFIVGIGGTPRSGSSSEKALAVSLEAAAAAGAETLLICGPELNLPMYNPNDPQRTAAAQRLIEAFRRCDGMIIASPGYHGSVSGLVKNALDYVEDMRGDRRVYFDGVAVGCIARAAGWQTAGHTLATLRSIAHALRGWPTPLGVALNTSSTLFDDSGACLDASAKAKLHTVGRQVVEFALQRRNLAMQV
jgi:FMN reductase